MLIMKVNVLNMNSNSLPFVPRNPLTNQFEVSGKLSKLVFFITNFFLLSKGKGPKKFQTPKLECWKESSFANCPNFVSFFENKSECLKYLC